MRKAKKTKVSHRLAAAATVGMVTGGSSGAFAIDGDINTLVGNLVTSSAGFTQLMNVLGYVGGSGMAVAGIFKLKQHVDNPGQTPMKDGIMRLAAGGALLTLPFITSVMQNSVGQDAAGNTVDQANVKVNNFE
jgi:hypothetical protein